MIVLTTGEMDYVQQIFQPLIFTAIDTTNCVDIQIVNDNTVENREAFSIAINTAEERVTLEPISAGIFIVDNDCKHHLNSSRSVYLILFFIHIVVTVSFKGDEVIQFVNEELSSTQVCLILSHTELQREITVTVATEEGTASGN